MEQLKNLLKRKEEKREGGKKRRWKKPVLAAVLAAAVLLIAIRGMMPQKTVLPTVEVYAAERGEFGRNAGCDRKDTDRTYENLFFSSGGRGGEL